MNEKAQRIINRTIASKSIYLNLSDLNLDYIDLPVNKLSNLKFIVLNHNRLISLPNNLLELPNLQSINAAENEFTKIPRIVWDLPNLKTINFNHNNITNINLPLSVKAPLEKIEINVNEISFLPKMFSKLQLLKEFYASNNKFEYFPTELCEINSLKVISLHKNNIKTVSSDIDKLNNLKTLYLSDNKINLFPTAICSCSNLSVLTLNNNQIQIIPDEISNLGFLSYLNLSHNKIKALPDEIGNLTSLEHAIFDYNDISDVPESISLLSMLESLSLVGCKIDRLNDEICFLHNLQSLNLSNNHLIELPERFYSLYGLKELHLNNNLLIDLPLHFSILIGLKSLNLRKNKFKEMPEELIKLEEVNPLLISDIRDNPFTSDTVLRSERIGKIWKETPRHLRELIKIYFGGFNLFYEKSTGKKINVKPINDDEGFVLDSTLDETHDPEIVEHYLNEYFTILKDKLEQGATTGNLWPTSDLDNANLYAQIQATTFAQSAVTLRELHKGHINDQDVYISLNESLIRMESAYHETTNKNTQLQKQLLQAVMLNAELKGESRTQRGEIDSRREEAKIRASIPLAIQVNQQNTITLNQQIGGDFEKLVERLYPFLSEFQKDKAKEVQRSIDELADTPNPTPEQKQKASRGLKRWLDSMSDTVKSGKQLADNVGEITKYWDKLKDFAGQVLHDPDVVNTIESIKQAIESATSS